MRVKFWGVRGSIACPGPSTARYGGNTACVQVDCGDRLVILDAGTGLRELGTTLSGAATADILLSHCHIDHISGLPFFAPFYDPESRFRVWAGNLRPRFNLSDTMRQMMSAPLFPIDVEHFLAGIDYLDFDAGTDVPLGGDIAVATVPLNHPDGATGYRLTFNGRSLAYITDTEAKPGAPDPALVNLLKNVDLMIYDSTYTDAEIEAHRGWGHSTWTDALRLADAAGVKRVCLFHHDPSHDDVFMDEVAQQAAARRVGTIVAKEGMVLEL